MEYSFLHRRSGVAFVLCITCLTGCQLDPNKNQQAKMPFSPDGSTIRYQEPDESTSESKTTTANKVDPANLVAKVEVKGNQSVPTHHLTRNIRTRPGRFFDPDLLQQDVEELTRMKQVRRVNRPIIEKTPQGVNVTIEVIERRLINQVKYIGNRAYADWQLRKVSELEEGKPLDLHEVRMAKQRLEDHYREKGFSRTQVDIAEGDQLGDNNVIFVIHEDNKQRIFKTGFVGNKIASDARLRSFIKTKPGILWVVGGAFNRDQLEQDQTRLTAYYRSLGFFNARIGREINESKNGWATIRFIIDEGPRYKVRNIAFIGNSKYRSADLATLVKMKPDQGKMPEFNSAKMNADVNSLRDMYGSQGHVFADVQAEPRFLEEPGMLDIVYKITEGEQYRVGKINVHIEGDYGVTKRQVVLNRLSLRPGDVIDVQEIRNSERRLGSTQIFAGGQGNPGPAPKVVVRPPDANRLERMAGRNSGSLHR